MVCLYNLQDLKSGWKVMPSFILAGLLNRKYWNIQLLVVLCLIVDGIPHWKVWWLVYLCSHGPLGLSNELMHGEYLIRTELVEFIYRIIKLISSNLQLSGDFNITQFSGHRSDMSSLLEVISMQVIQAVSFAGVGHLIPWFYLSNAWRNGLSTLKIGKSLCMLLSVIPIFRDCCFVSWCTLRLCGNRIICALY